MTSSFKRILPALNRILIKKIEPVNKSPGGIILQEAADKANVGEVLQIGPGNVDSNGKLIPLTVKIGDKILLPDYGGTKINLKDGEFWIYRDSDVIGTLHKDQFDFVSTCIFQMAYIVMYDNDDEYML